MDTTPHVEWLRPEYKGRDDELVYLAEAARVAGVSRAVLANWARRYTTFPAVAKVITGPNILRKFIPRAEFDVFLEERMEKAAGKPGPKKGTVYASPRPPVVIAAERVDRYTRRVATLEAREKEQAARLAKTRAALELARTRAEQAREKLAAELAAADQVRAAG